MCLCRFITLSAVLVSMAALAPDRVSAQEETASRDDLARSLFLEAREAYGAQRFADALTKFRASYELSGRHELLFNIASAAEEVGDDQLALDNYRHFIQQVPSSANRAEADARILEIENRLGDRVRPTAPLVTETATPDPVVTPEPAAEPRVVFVTHPQAEQVDEPRSKLWIVGVVVGVAVVAGGVATYLALRNRTADPVLGDDGEIHYALTSW